jgi:hypothetical protein
VSEGGLDTKLHGGFAELTCGYLPVEVPPSDALPMLSTLVLGRTALSSGLGPQHDNRVCAAAGYGRTVNVQLLEGGSYEDRITA